MAQPFLIQTSCSTPAADSAAGISERHTTAHENGSDISGGAFSSDDGALAGTLVCMFLALSDDPGRPLPCLKGCKGHRCGKGQGHTCTTNVALTDAASAAGNYTPTHPVSEKQARAMLRRWPGPVRRRPAVKDLVSCGMCEHVGPTLTAGDRLTTAHGLRRTRTRYSPVHSPTAAARRVTIRVPPRRPCAPRWTPPI